METNRDDRVIAAVRALGDDRVIAAVRAAKDAYAAMHGHDIAAIFRGRSRLARDFGAARTSAISNA